MGNKNKTLWTYSEQEKVLELSNEGWPAAHIAEVVGRTKSAIELRLRLLRRGDKRRPIKRGEELADFAKELSFLPAAEIAAWAGVTVKEVLTVGVEHGIKYGNRNLPMNGSSELKEGERTLLIETLTELSKRCEALTRCSCEHCDLKARLNEIWDKGRYGRQLFNILRPFMIGGDKYDG